MLEREGNGKVERSSPQGFLREKKEILTWPPPPSVYEVVPKKVNGADFEEEREPLRGVTMQIRENGHRSINHATRVHARFDDGFK